MKRKIIGVTGARSEYDLLFEVYKKLDNDPLIDFSLIVTGAHLSENYGRTVDYIENDGFKIIGKIFNLIDTNSKIGRIISLGNQIQSISQILNLEKPDIVLVAGDREESLSITTITAYLSIPCAHFFGGDIAKDGNIDNSVRYAASKLATIHFPTLEQHKATLIKLGEDEWRIHVMGNPALDRLLTTPIISKKELFSYLKFNQEEDKYFVLIQHSIISEAELQKKHIRETLDAIYNSKVKCFINYPNSDAGNKDIIDAYVEYSNKYPEVFFLFKNLNRLTYINLLRNASCLLGNSSSGILEVASLGLPVINIGNRQKGRISGQNVIYVDNVKEDILEAIDKIQNDDSFMKLVKKKHNPYGEGKSSDFVVKTLKNIEISDKLIYKNITY
jgi:GDP/UDP-N,N'-diacetylbacillosamine 2-epimerase (hydrolysing)